MTARDLASLLGGELCGEAPIVRGFATDSRSVSAGDAFLAIVGAQVDGHQFVNVAREHGAALSVVEREVDGPHIHVENLVAALARMGGTIRDQFAGPVIGITGSAGKTTVKEFVAAALSPLGPILKTPANRNTEYTVPLIWPELQETHRAVVVEMAMRGFHQIAHLASFCRPNIGIVTNIGYSHLEMVGSREGIARAKGELLQALPTDGVAILWSEDEYLSTLVAMAPGVTKTFGFSENADCRITHYQALNWGQCRIKGEIEGSKWEAMLPAVGRHIATGAAAALLAAQECGIELKAASDALSNVALPPMRMEIREVEGVTYVLDTYNASPASMIAALETVAEMETAGRRRALIGEMRELGDSTEESHRAVGSALHRLNLHDVLFYGEATHWAKEALGAGEVTQSIDEARAFVRDSKPGDVVLIKGSRSLELERVLV